MIGISAKFGPTNLDTSLILIGQLGVISDLTSCEEAIFTAPNPFTTMTVDVYTGATVTQMQTIYLSTLWGEGDCAYTYSVNSAETWMSHSKLFSTNQI